MITVVTSNVEVGQPHHITSPRKLVDLPHYYYQRLETKNYPFAVASMGKMFIPYFIRTKSAVLKLKEVYRATLYSLYVLLLFTSLKDCISRTELLTVMPRFLASKRHTGYLYTTQKAGLLML
jgi:hypothetical protein